MSSGHRGNQVDLLDLRVCPRRDLFDRFVELYLKTFTDSTECEDPSDWPRRMWQDAPSPQPFTHILLALPQGVGQDPSDILGGLVFEYYRESRCGLLTYLVVHPDHRRQGLGGMLVQRAKSILADDSARLGRRLEAVFCESENPELVQDTSSPMPLRQRLQALWAMGARPLDLPYVQPQLAGGTGRCRHLFLLACQEPQEPPAPVDGRIIRDFLHEFYRALGVEQPEGDKDFQDMARHLAGKVRVRKPLQGDEQP